MAVWSVGILLLAVAGTAVLADSRFTFPESLRESTSTRIVSGWEAEEGQIPHQVSLRMVNPAGAVSACGGSVISSRYGLTAAHCTATRVTLVARLGTVNMTRPGYIFETTRYWNHPLYNEAMQSVVQPNDIGLIEFGHEVIFTDTIKPIRIQRSSARNTNYAGQLSVASGWGRTETNGGSPENLNWVFLRLTSNSECWSAFGGSSIIQDSTICARWFNETSQSTCSGDSGGPLTTTDDDGQITQVGVTSFVSATGCHTGFPAGFVRPGFYHDWFTQITGIDFDWEYEPTEAPETTIIDVVSTTPSDTTTEAVITTESGDPSLPDTTTEAVITTESGDPSLPDTTTEVVITTEAGDSSLPDTTTEAVITTEAGDSSLPDTTTEVVITTEAGDSSLPDTTTEAVITTEAGATSPPEIPTEAVITTEAGDSSLPDATTEAVAITANSN